MRAAAGTAPPGASRTKEEQHLRDMAARQRGKARREYLKRRNAIAGAQVDALISAGVGAVQAGYERTLAEQREWDPRATGGQ